MPEIRKTTREVTTYEVSLSEGDFEALTDILAESRHAAAYQLYQALGLALTGDAATPLADGDRIRVLRGCPRNAAGYGYSSLRQGDVLVVDYAEPDSDGDVFAENDDHCAYLAASGPYAADWERVTDAPALSAGDRIRILKDGLSGARVDAGDVLTVKSVSADTFKTNAPRHHYEPATGTWTFMTEDEGNGWERIALRRIAKGDHIRMLKHVGGYGIGEVLPVTEAPNVYRNFSVRGLYRSTALLSEHTEGDVWERTNG